jgi:hypothetical protein
MSTSSVAQADKGEYQRYRRLQVQKSGISPSMLVTVPPEVPFTMTFTPGTGVPSSSPVTVPVTVRCAHDTDMAIMVTAQNSRIFFILHYLKVKNSSPNVKFRMRKCKSKSDQ